MFPIYIILTLLIIKEGPWSMITIIRSTRFSVSLPRQQHKFLLVHPLLLAPVPLYLSQQHFRRDFAFLRI